MTSYGCVIASDPAKVPVPLDCTIAINGYIFGGKGPAFFPTEVLEFTRSDPILSAMQDVDGLQATLFGL